MSEFKADALGKMIGVLVGTEQQNWDKLTEKLKTASDNNTDATLTSGEVHFAHAAAQVMREHRLQIRQLLQPGDTNT